MSNSQHNNNILSSKNIQVKINFKQALKNLDNNNQALKNLDNKLLSNLQQITNIKKFR